MCIMVKKVPTVLAHSGGAFGLARRASSGLSRYLAYGYWAHNRIMEDSK